MNSTGLQHATKHIGPCAFSYYGRLVHASAKLHKQEGRPELDKNLKQSTIPGEQSSTTGKKKKTMKELDDELRAAMEGRAGDGGLAGAELEGGKAVAMKRGVRDNMFRYI